MENITFRLSDSYKYGSAYFDYLALRKQFFVDKLGWDIPHNDDLEMDQYDNPEARYSLVLDQGRVIAGARAMACSAKWGEHTYMLGDAMTGKLGTIPSTVLRHHIVSSEVWECTRLVIAPAVKSMKMRNLCLDMIVDGLIDMAAREGAHRLISLSNLWLLRSLRRLGYGAELLGDPYVNKDDGHKYAVMAIEAEPTAPRLPRHTHRPQPGVVHAPAA